MADLLDDNYYYSICYGNGTFIALTGEGRPVRSTDGGVTWTAPVGITGNSWSSMTYGYNRFGWGSTKYDKEVMTTRTQGNTMKL
jgi:hypothetical protein